MACAELTWEFGWGYPLAVLNALLLSFKECFVTDELGGTEHDTLWDSSGLDCSDLESGLQEFVDWGCERGLTGGEASQQMNMFHLNVEVLCWFVFLKTMKFYVRLFTFLF
jgi:hypothetical protein